MEYFCTATGQKFALMDNGVLDEIEKTPDTFLWTKNLLAGYILVVF